MSPVPKIVKPPNYLKELRKSKILNKNVKSWDKIASNPGKIFRNMAFFINILYAKFVILILISYLIVNSSFALSLYFISN